MRKRRPDEGSEVVRDTERAHGDLGMCRAEREVETIVSELGGHDPPVEWARYENLASAKIDYEEALARGEDEPPAPLGNSQVSGALGPEERRAAVRKAGAGGDNEDSDSGISH